MVGYFVGHETQVLATATAVATADYGEILSKSRAVLIFQLKWRFYSHATVRLAALWKTL